MTSIALEMFAEKFYLAQTQGKLVNFAPEWSQLTPRIEGVLKAFTGGGLHRGSEGRALFQFYHRRDWS